MLPGLSDADCRVAELRYRMLHAEAVRQRLAATACTQSDRGRVTETLQHHIATLMELAGQLLQGARTQEATEQATVPGTLAVSK